MRAKLCTRVRLIFRVERGCVDNWRAGASQPSRSFERNFLFIYIRPSCSAKATKKWRK